MFTVKKATCIILLLLSFSCSDAQKLTIKGKIVDTNGEAVPFATVTIKGTRKGVQSDVEGNFSLQHDKKNTTISFSALGFKSLEKKLREKDFTDSVAVISITMELAPTTLNEVVITGYGAAKKADRSSATYNYAVETPGATHTVKSKFAPAGAAASSATVMYSDVVVTTAKGFDRKARTEARRTGTEREAKAVYTSLLTAGEVNDFKKWKMWEDYNDSDFKIHSDKWNLYATQRYSVQLQNDDHKAITGETVYLVNKTTKEIIWTAVSDNTGKAELWNGFSNNNKEQNLAIEVKGEKVPFIAIPFSQGINHLQLKRNCSVSNKVEISFVVDATGSMSDEIEYLKEELGDILTKFSMKEPSLELYTSALFYKDKGDDYVTSIQPFTNNISNTLNYIKKQFAGGGGDYPEAVKEALEEATEKLAWSNDARTKIIFLLMDAPPHDETNKQMATLIAKAAAKGIRIVPVACSGTDKATEFIMRSMALATNGTYLFLTDDSGIGNPHIKPTTDEFKVELLNDLLQRIMEQMCFVNTCTEKTTTVQPVIKYSNSEKVKVFPNPTQGPITLETDKELEEILVTDFTGKIVLRNVVKDIKKQYRIDLSPFPSATYLIKYTTKENKAGAEKIIVIH